MPPTKVIQHPPCLHCGKPMERKRYNGRLEDSTVFSRRKFCDQTCMAAAFDARPSAATSRTAKTGNYHARKLVPAGPCAECGKPKARDVHHLNGNRDDNRPENLTRLCRSCHLRLHTWPERRRTSQGLRSQRRSGASVTGGRAST